MSFYKEHIRINKNFQSSINLELDLNSDKKIKEYIPTSDICDILNRYFESFLGIRKDYATTLVGPYGKGKSFLLLVLSYLISADKNNEVYKDLIRKINAVNPELSQNISVFRKKNRLLPIIVNSNYHDINQAFLLALNEALTRDGLQHIIPKTAYSVCVELIDKWERNSEYNKTTLAKCLEINHVNLASLRNELNEYSEKAYKQFEDLYNCVTMGMAFNPLVNNDIVKTYAQINHQICEIGYSGMFIIFDEFSKFLEGTGNTLMKDLKIVQDIAELCARSSNSEQFHLCCVTHKSLSLYDKVTKNSTAFRTVEGRFKEIAFNRSMDENYQMIAAAIRKDGYEQNIRDYILQHAAFYEEVKNCQSFRDMTDYKTLFEGCFPLNPLTVFSVIQLSEIVAQNERTLFTFISDTDDSSLNSFVHKTEACTALFNVDKVYDYFSPQMKKESENGIRNLWYRAESILTKIEDPTTKKLIKALAVILMINDNNRLASDEDNLALAICEDKKIVKKLIEQLAQEHYLRRNPISNLLSFGSSNNQTIENDVNLLKKTKGKLLNYESILEEIDERKYVLPRKYNEENKITRFYRIGYITEQQFLSIKSFDYMKNSKPSDGLVVNLLSTSLTPDQVMQAISHEGDENVIVRVPDRTIDQVFYDSLLRYAALKELHHKYRNDDLLKNEVTLLLQETKEDVQKMIDLYFNKDCRIYNSIIDADISFNTLLSQVMSNVYTKKLVFNNELVNKTNVTTQYQKPVINVMNWILSGRDESSFKYSLTSPEQSIRMSIVDAIDSQEAAREIVNYIKTFIQSSENEKKKVSELHRFFAAPYGLRKGILPILIAVAVSELSDNVILYQKNNEVELNATNIVKAANSEGLYAFGFAKGSMSQTIYLNTLLQKFGNNPTDNFRIDTRTLCEKYREFFVGLPSIIRYDNAKSEYLGIPESILKYKDQFMSFNLNPYETVYTKVLDCLRTDNYHEISGKLIDFIDNWNSYIGQYKQVIVAGLKEAFNINEETSLKMGLNDYITAVTDDRTVVLSTDSSRIKNAIETMSYNDGEAIDKLSIACLGVHVEDWTTDRQNDLISAMLDFRNAMDNSKAIEADTSALDSIINMNADAEISPMGSMLKNSLDSVFEEFGESVSAEEKVAILAEYIKQMI